MVGEIAFVPIEVLLVTFIIHRMLDLREKKMILRKLNMVVGVFFSEVGKDVLAILSEYDTSIKSVKSKLVVKDDWNEKDFDEVVKYFKAYQYSVDLPDVNIEKLKSLLISKREFLIKLLENPILLEHDAFTETLRSIFHLEEELASRRETALIPEEDKKHIKGDMSRVYAYLVVEWIEYMRYLKSEYPYLFSFALRTNPFDKEASIEIK
jgi:hypothetical protein